MQHTFHTPGPTSLYVEIGSGTTRVQTADTDQTEVGVEGRDADRVTVEQRGDEIVVKADDRRAGFLSFGSDVSVSVTLPHGSDLTAKLGSADLVATGRYGAVHVKAGSGDLTLGDTTREAVVLTGSGDVRIDSATGDLRVKSGSGSVTVGRVEGTTVLTSGSGRIAIGSAHDETVAKTGSGDVRIGETTHSVSVTSGSGDLEVGTASRGRVRAKSASGDVLVGVPAGVPVWTDISCVTGSIHSTLEGAGAPDEGQDHVEIRATTVSGDVSLTQI